LKTLLECTRTRQKTSWKAGHYSFHWEMGWLRRGNERNVYAGLRQQMLTLDPATVHLAPSAEHPHVFAGLMEMGVGGDVVTLVVVADGTTSFIGVPAVASSARASTNGSRGQARASWPRSSSTSPSLAPTPTVRRRPQA